MDGVSNFVAKNAWALIITIIGIAGTYSVNSYRISALERELAEVKTHISVVNQVAIDVAVLRERTENLNEKVDSILDAFKIKN